MKKIYFSKMSGAGNDFVVIDRNNNPGVILENSTIKNICDRRNGIGADGLITIADCPDFNFLMEYFNSDGSTGSLCGNGARCALKFADITGRIKNGNANFISNKNKYSGEILGENKIKFNLNSPENVELDFLLKLNENQFKVDFIDTGSPHVVVEIKNLNFGNINAVPVYDLGKEIRNHNHFSPDGTNVNFIDIKEDKIYIRTFERGVEDETLACGTGSVAAAVISYLNKKATPPITLVTRGGAELIVDFSISKEKVENLSLTGPAKVTFTGEFLLKTYL